MPAKEDNEPKTANDHVGQSQPLEDPVVIVQQENVQRELTQTDQLNKQLLKSFLEKLNQNTIDMKTFAPNEDNDADDSDFK